MVHLSVPSKTFLIGEYAALEGGPSIIVNTEPRFGLRVLPGGSGTVTGISPPSPAGQYITKYEDFFHQYDLDFFDPHDAKGGLGASSAQFALCCALKNMVADEKIQPYAVEEIHEQYLDVAWTGEGMAPSGSDVLAQTMGREITFVHRNEGIVQGISWPFEDIKFTVVRTGFKLPTHIHLTQLKDISFDELQAHVLAAWDALNESKEQEFLRTINDFTNTLAKNKLIAPETVQWLEVINQWNGVRAIKGCGALGADTILIVHSANSTAKIHERLLKLRLEVLATEEDLTNGLEIHPTEASLKEALCEL